MRKSADNPAGYPSTPWQKERERVRKEAQKKIHRLILAEFKRQKAKGRLTLDEFCHRIDVHEQWTRMMLESPCDLTWERASDMLFALGLELDIKVRPIRRG